MFGIWRRLSLLCWTRGSFGSTFPGGCRWGPVVGPFLTQFFVAPGSELCEVVYVKISRGCEKEKGIVEHSQPCIDKRQGVIELAKHASRTRNNTGVSGLATT